MLAVAGEDYVVCAADTRMSTGYNILTRDYKKIDQMSDKCVLASAGFMADAVTLKKALKARCTTYEFQNDKPMGCVSFAQMLSNTLYYRRFFPYYTFNIVAGLDAGGQERGVHLRRGGVLREDKLLVPRERAGADHARAGQPAQNGVPTRAASAVERDALERIGAVDLVKDCFATAGERDIYTGDTVEIWIINKDGVRKEYQELKLD